MNQRLKKILLAPLTLPAAIVSVSILFLGTFSMKVGISDLPPYIMAIVLSPLIGLQWLMDKLNGVRRK